MAALLLLAFVAVVSTLADPDVRVPLVAWFVLLSTGLCAAWSSWFGATLLLQMRRRPAEAGGWRWDGEQWVRSEPGSRDRA
jgi:hypothetical protein